MREMKAEGPGVSAAETNGVGAGGSQESESTGKVVKDSVLVPGQ